jgi:HEAT repeat protein
MRPVDIRATAPVLLAALKHRDPAVRLEAALVLIHMGPAEAKATVPTLIDLLNEPAFNQRLQAAHALGRIGPAAKEAIPSLVELLYDPTTAVATAGAHALSQLRPESIRAVLDTWTHEESVHRPFVILALELLGPSAGPAVPKLIEALASPHAVIRNAAGPALQQIGKDAVPYLCRALGGENSTHFVRDPIVRQAIVRILGQMGPAAGDAVPALTQALKDSDLRIRLQAAQALWEVDRSAERILPTLLDGLKDKNVSLRRQSATVLGEMEHVPQSGVSALQAALKDQDPDIRIKVAGSLCTIPDHVDQALPVLTAELKNRQLRSHAVDALRKAGAAAREAIPALLSGLQDDSADPVYVNRIGSALQQIGGPAVVEELVRAYPGSSKKSRARIAQALSQTGPAGVAALLKLIDDDDPVVRLIVVSATGRSTDAVPALVKALRDKDPKVRQQAMRAMGQLGAAAQAAIPTLTELLQTEDV